VNRRKAFVALGSLAGGAAACLSVAVVLAGCPNTATTTLYTPSTGIQIDSQQLVAGVGCGSGPGLVYRYAALVGPPATDGGLGIQVGATPYASGVFDCFSDALFTNLPAPDGGPAGFGVDIYAYDRASFPAELEGCEYVPSAVPCAGDDAAVVGRYESRAAWTTHCTATQYQGVPQFAFCNELMPADAGTTGDAGDAGEMADGGDAADGSDVAAPGDAADAAEAATVEASDGPGVSGEGGDAPLE
jgi:hypothetical protein